jgi:protein-S-isoprenylcysteine O-methyltransferase Ste14
MATKTQLIIEIVLFIVMLAATACKMNKDYKLRNRLSIYGLLSFGGIFILQAWMSVTAIFIPAGFIHNQVLFTLGIVFMVLGLLGMVLGIMQMGNYKEILGLHSSRLLSKGIYHFTRHPVYVGYVLLITGLAIAWWNHYAVVSILTSMMMVYVFVLVEDIHLTRQFGEEHRYYCLKTKRFL